MKLLIIGALNSYARTKRAEHINTIEGARGNLK